MKTREEKEKVILDYLCFDQIGTHIYGKHNDDWAEVNWLEGQQAWQVLVFDQGVLELHYNIEKNIDVISDEIIDDMFSGISDEEEEEEQV